MSREWSKTLGVKYIVQHLTKEGGEQQSLSEHSTEQYAHSRNPRELSPTFTD